MRTRNPIFNSQGFLTNIGGNYFMRHISLFSSGKTTKYAAPPSTTIRSTIPSYNTPHQKGEQSKFGPKLFKTCVGPDVFHEKTGIGTKKNKFKLKCPTTRVCRPDIPGANCCIFNSKTIFFTKMVSTVHIGGRRSPQTPLKVVPLNPCTVADTLHRGRHPAPFPNIHPTQNLQPQKQFIRTRQNTLPHARALYVCI